jgi:hypothetical protein
VLPALSVAVTLSVFVPLLEVSSKAPDGTVPAQLATPEGESAQV